MKRSVGYFLLGGSAWPCTKTNEVIYIFALAIYSESLWLTKMKQPSASLRYEQYLQTLFEKELVHAVDSFFTPRSFRRCFTPWSMRSFFIPCTTKDIKTLLLYETVSLGFPVLFRRPLGYFLARYCHRSTTTNVWTYIENAGSEKFALPAAAAVNAPHDRMRERVRV